MTTFTTGLRERIRCPRCGVRSIFVGERLDIQDKDGHHILIDSWSGLTVRCKCGSQYALAPSTRLTADIH